MLLKKLEVNSRRHSPKTSDHLWRKEIGGQKGVLFYYDHYQTTDFQTVSLSMYYFVKTIK